MYTPLSNKTAEGRWWIQHHLKWKPVEEQQFAEFRRRSDEAFAIPAAIERLVQTWFDIRSDDATLFDVGASDGGLLSSQLRGRFRGYTAVPFDGRWAHSSHHHLLDPDVIDLPTKADVFAAVHVVQYMLRPDLVLADLRHFAAADAVIVVVMLDLTGDQQRAWELALEYAPGYPYRYDQASVIADWLAASGIETFQSVIWSATTINNDTTLRNTLSFFLGTESEELIHHVALAFRGRRRLTTAHRVLAWRIPES